VRSTTPSPAGLSTACAVRSRRLWWLFSVCLSVDQRLTETTMLNRDGHETTVSRRDQSRPTVVDRWFGFMLTANDDGNYVVIGAVDYWSSGHLGSRAITTWSTRRQEEPALFVCHRNRIVSCRIVLISTINPQMSAEGPRDARDELSTSDIKVQRHSQGAARALRVNVPRYTATCLVFK